MIETLDQFVGFLTVTVGDYTLTVNREPYLGRYCMVLWLKIGPTQKTARCGDSLQSGIAELLEAFQLDTAAGQAKAARMAITV